MKVHLLDDSGLSIDHPGGYSACIGFDSVDAEGLAMVRRQERSDFFRRLTHQKEGGILVVEEEGRVIGWMSFMERDVARRILWPCRRERVSGRVLVVGCLLVDLAYRGRGIAGELLAAFEALAGEWGYDEIESPCRDENTYDDDLTFQTPAPFKKRGYVEVDCFHCNLMYPAEFSVWAWRRRPGK